MGKHLVVFSRTLDVVEFACRVEGRWFCALSSFTPLRVTKHRGFSQYVRELWLFLPEREEVPGSKYEEWPSRW